MLWFRLRPACATIALAALLGGAADAQTPGKVDTSTLYGKNIMGFQGWFACPGDAAGRGWVHWKAGDAFTVEMLPDVSELDPSELCDTGLVGRDGKPVKVFSDQNPRTVDRQFGWMQSYGLDGVALQRFGSVLFHPETLRASNNVVANVRAAAAHHERGYFLMYDLSGVKNDQLALVVDDWRRWIADGMTREPAYFRHRGHPVLGLWGIGFAGRDMTPAVAADFLAAIRAASAPAGGVTILGGTPTWWRAGTGDAGPDPGWKAVWPQLDIISPWTVGRYVDDASADHYRSGGLVPDIAATKAMGVDYMPVAFPGFGWSNLMLAQHQNAKAIRNAVPRRCGAFYRRQVANAAAAGARMLYTAMFDEVDEGTAMFKLDAQRAESPDKPEFLTLDEDGCRGGGDLYLRMGADVDTALRANGRTK